MGGSNYSELPDSLAIFSPGKAEEPKRSHKLRKATTTQSRWKKGSEDGNEWVFRGAHILSGCVTGGILLAYGLLRKKKNGFS